MTGTRLDMLDQAREGAEQAAAFGVWALVAPGGMYAPCEMLVEGGERQKAEVVGDAEVAFVALRTGVPGALGGDGRRWRQRFGSMFE